MRTLPQMLQCLVVVTLVLMAVNAAAQDDSRNEFWPEISAYYRVTPAYRLFFNYAPALSNEDSYAEGDLGAALEMGLFPILRGELVKRYDEDRLRFLRLRIGARYAASLPASEGSSTEWRGIVQITGRAALPWNSLASLRNLLELRWLEEGFSGRYRIRLGLEKDVRVFSGHAITPFTSVEAFYDSRFDIWNRLRYKLGVALPISRSLSIVTYYVRQENRRSEIAHVNALGIVAALFF